MSTKHTPGPWNYNGKSRAVYAGNVSVANCGRTAAGAPAEDADGNCWLIAAAPDLLEALQASLGTFDYKAKQKWQKVHAAGLTAITRATGGEVGTVPSGGHAPTYEHLTPEQEDHLAGRLLEIMTTDCDNDREYLHHCLVDYIDKMDTAQQLDALAGTDCDMHGELLGFDPETGEATNG